MNRSIVSSVVGLVASVGLVGCAHTEKPVVVAPKPEVAAPAPAPQLTATQVTPAPDPMEEINAALRSATVLFDFNRDALKPQGMDALQKVASVLRKHPDVVLKVEGNCDERGTEEYNLALGQRRAEVARKYLADMGVSPKQLDAISYGALRPANPAHTEEAWSQNRRDDLRASR